MKAIVPTLLAFRLARCFASRFFSASLRDHYKPFYGASLVHSVCVCVRFPLVLSLTRLPTHVYMLRLCACVLDELTRRFGARRTSGGDDSDDSSNDHGVKIGAAACLPAAIHGPIHIRHENQIYSLVWFKTSCGKGLFSVSRSSCFSIIRIF